MKFSQVFSHDTVAGIFAAVIFLYAISTLYGRLFAAHRRRPPPQASGALPLIGHLHLLAGKEPAHITFGKMADKFGPIFTLKSGVYTNLIVSNWEIAKECLTTNDKIFASRPTLAASKILGYDCAMMGLSPYGPHWRYVRKLATLELLTSHRLEQLQHIRIFEVRSSIRKLYNLCIDNNSKNNGNNKVVVEMKAWFGDITLNMIFRMVVGKRFSTAVDGNGDEEYRKALRDFFEWFGVFVPSDAFPFLKWFDFGGHEKAMKKTAKVLDEVFDKWLEEHRQKRSLGEVKMEEEGHDFMHVMISSVKDNEDVSNYDADTVTKATCLALILAGSDTTTITMIWTLTLLLNNEDKLKKAQLELDEQVGQQRQVKESDIKNLPYLQAIVKETLRLYPAAPLTIPHESMEDCNVAGYHIPKGTRLIVNLQKLQRDEQIWENPLEFRPERFLTSHKDFDVRGQSPQFIPFGSGRRMCPGVSFALQVLHLTLANLLHGFEISRPFDEVLDMEESAGMTSIRKNLLEVALSPRLLAQVYE